MIANEKSVHKKVVSEEKEALRRRLLKARQTIPPRLRQAKSARICHHLSNWETFAASKLTLAYCSFRGEPQLDSLFQQPHRVWGLPRCEGQTLIWHRWFRYSQWSLRTGTYGITEPDSSAPSVEPYQVDLILVPCLACDVNGYRLGYGGGFYDRMLNNPKWADIPTIGIVFEYARLPLVPKEDWDIRLHGVCTESGLFLLPQP